MERRKWLTGTQITDDVLYRAKKVLRKYNSGFGKRGARIHKIAAGDTADRIRALNGICGECLNLTIAFVNRDGKNIACIGCDKKNRPIDLYNETPLGTTANCKDYNPRSK